MVIVISYLQFEEMSMKLILLHGPPAAGKYTTAKSISNIVPAKILHNHLIVDLALSVYDSFGQDDFFEFNTDLRIMAMEKALKSETEILVMTWCYSYPKDEIYLERILSFCRSKKIELFPVFVSPKEDILYIRAVEKERFQTNKVNDTKLLGELLANNSYRPIIHENIMEFDNSDTLPEGVAMRILEGMECVKI